MQNIPIKLKNGATLHVEAEGAPEAVAAFTARADADLRPRGGAMSPPKSPAAIAETQFSDAVRVVAGVADEVTEGLVKKDDTSRRLSEIGLEIQLGFDAEGNVYFVKGKASAVLKLNLKWTIPPAS